MRYAIAGATVGLIYFGGPVALDGAGVPIEAAIPVCYVAAICLHFALQRKFVFRHVEVFALSRREQAVRYLMIGAVQYPTNALSTAVLPSVLGVSQRAVYLCVAATMSVIFFIVLRTHVFHSGLGQPAPPPELSGDESEVGELELLGGHGSTGER